MVKGANCFRVNQSWISLVLEYGLESTHNKKKITTCDLLDVNDDVTVHHK